MGNRPSSTTPTSGTTPTSSTTPRSDQQHAQRGAQDPPEAPRIARRDLSMTLMQTFFPELFGFVEQRHAYQANRRPANQSSRQGSANPSLPSLTAHRLQQHRQENHYARLPFSSAQLQAEQRQAVPLRLPDPPAVPPWRLARRLARRRNQLPLESRNAGADTTAATTLAGATSATTTAGASEQQPNAGLRAIAEWRAARLLRAPSQDSHDDVPSAGDRTSASASRSLPVAAPRQPHSRKPPNVQPSEWQHDDGGDTIPTRPPPLLLSNPPSSASLPSQPQRRKRPVAQPRLSLSRNSVQPVVVQRISDGDANAAMTGLGDAAASRSSRTISSPTGAYQPERSRKQPMPAPRRARQRVELHPPLPTQGSDSFELLLPSPRHCSDACSAPPAVDEIGSTPRNAAIVLAQGALKAAIARSDPPPKPPSPLSVTAAAVAASIPVHVDISAPSPTARHQNRDKATIGESAGKLPSSPHNFGRRANSAAGACSVRWSADLAVTVPPPPLQPPPPPPLRFSSVAAAAASPVRVAVAATSPTALGRNCDNTVVGESGNLAVTVPPPPPPLPPPHSFSVAAATGSVHYAVATLAAQQPTAQRRNRDQATVRQSAAAADTTLPAEPRRRQKELPQRQPPPQPTQRRRHGEAQTRRLNATTGRPLPRMLDEALDDEMLLAIQRIAAKRGSALQSSSYRFDRRPNSATSSYSDRWGDDLFGAAEAAPYPQSFSVFEFDDSAAAEEEQRRECELRRAQHELYDDELWRRTGEAAAASSSVPRRLHYDAFASGEVSTVAADRQSTTSAPASTTTSHWGAARPASSRGAEGSRGGRGASSGLPLCGRLQPEARYYGSSPHVPK